MSSTLTVTPAQVAVTAIEELKGKGANKGRITVVGQNHLTEETKSKSAWNLDDNGRFADHPEDISEFLIPKHAGASTTTNLTQSKTKMRYLILVATGTTLFYATSNPRLRTAAVSAIFPGAGFLAMGGIGGAIGFIITVALLPVCLFAWFGAGGLAFPLADWIFSGIIATYFTGETVNQASCAATLGIVGVIYTYLKTRSDYEEVADAERRERRNAYLPKVDEKWAVESTVATEDGTRELGLEQLRFVQYILELASQDFDNWENMTVIDQFQPAALRYQLYEFVNCLGLYQCIYTPNFHGVLSAGIRNAIEKSLTPKVLNFWKWESLWGKFTTDYDPVIKDNIMVTGFMVLALCIYQSNTGDDRYTKKDCLKMQITDKISYRHDLHSMYKALIKNWEESDFTLYPCEPNWIYSMCNLEGMAGATVYDRLYGTESTRRLMADFYKHFEEDFFTKGGSCIPIKSALTGFTIPGLCGITGDTSNALFCAPFMPTLAKRMWLITREENVRYDEDGKVQIVNLKGADIMDASNYQTSMRGPYANFATPAAEWGDKDITDQCLERLDKEHAVAEIANPVTGSMRNKGMGVLVQGMVTRARMMLGGDWARTVSKGPSKTALAGPILDDAPYPDVLVAKAYSHTSKDLDLVLYPGRKPCTATLTVTRLQPGVSYKGQNGAHITADASGKASFPVELDGRTAVHLQPL